MNVGARLIVGAALLLLPHHGINACKCPRPTVCEGVDNADVVVRAVLISSVDDEEDTFWADTVLKVVEVFKTETGLEKYAAGEEFHAFTPGSSNSCGAWTDFGEEYLVDLKRREDALYAIIPCGIYRNWSYLSEDDEESLRSCTCAGGCGTFQECVENTQGYLQDGVAVETYCADVCDPSPCGDGEVCELYPVPCIPETVCPPLAVCTPDTLEPTPAPTTPVGIISCGSYECDAAAGYINVDRECSTVPSPSGRVRGRRLQSSDGGGFYTTDGYTTLGNYPICSQDVCCEGGPTPAPASTPPPIVSGPSCDCGPFQECVQNTRGYLQDGVAVETYCADVCDPSPCGDGEVCELYPVPCIPETVCPPLAVCTPDTLEPTPAPTTPGPAQAEPISLGCFKDVRNDRILDDRALVDLSLTTELCEFTCAGSSYFSTQYGQECWCGSAETDYAQHGESTGCTYECPGSPDETCGGYYAANVYAYATTTTPSSSYLGCFKDGRDRIMEVALEDSSSMTKELCETECAGSTYFGLQYRRECWCGGQDTDLFKHGEESTACSYECPGDPDQTCGGDWAMSVYEFN